MRSMELARWLHPVDPSAGCTGRILLFHHSGGSAARYSRLLTPLPSHLARQSIQLPGRQERFNEEPFDHIDPLIAALIELLGPELSSTPYVLFGHSMGALIAYRLTVELTRQGWNAPAGLIISSWLPQPRHWPGQERGLTDLEPAEVNSPAAQSSALTRADSAVCMSYDDDAAQVEIPVITYGSTQDDLTPSHAIRALWSQRASTYEGHREFPGDHFYLWDHGAELTQDLVGLLRRTQPAARQAHLTARER